MAMYLIESPHTQDECLRSLDELESRGKDTLDRFEFGCHHGVHTAWATMEAKSEADARTVLPSFVRSRARVVEVDRETPEKIRSYHNMK